METNERRKFLRIGRDAEVTMRLIAFPLESTVPVVVEMFDVSSGGVGMISPVEFSEGASVEVALKLPGWFKHTTTITRYREDNRTLNAVGKVTRCLPMPDGTFELGVEFTDIWADHWKAMRQYLAELSAGE